MERRVLEEEGVGEKGVREKVVSGKGCWRERC